MNGNTYYNYELTRNERRIRNNRIRRQRELRRNVMLTVMTICFIITFSISLNGFLSNAKGSSGREVHKCYKSITISNGDSLWSIAKDNMDEEQYPSIYSYIKEVKQINSLHTNSINYGECLIIPYYTHNYK